MQDPYEVLGVSKDADMDEIKKAYRALSRKYHPDANINNPHKEEAEEMFKQVQKAYQQIVDEKEHGTSAQNGYGSYGNQGYNGYGFGSYGYGAYGNGYGRNSGHAAEDTPEMQAAANYINNRYYQEALNALSQMQERPARWYYLHALANAGLGNNVNAKEDAEKAMNMEPDNVYYRQLYQQLSGAGGWYMNQGQNYGYSQCDGSSMYRACCTCLMLSMCCGGGGMCYPCLCYC